MKIARHWKRARVHVTGPSGKTFDVAAWGWSSDDPEEADRRAAESVRRTAARITAGEPFPGGYGYLDGRPNREEIVEEIEGSEGGTIAMITRNRYGALVLNTAELAFIDIDLPAKTPGGNFIDSIKKLFGKASPAPEDRVREQIAENARNRPDLTIRLYRTKAGFRCAVTSKRLNPQSAESEALLASFGCDPLYVRLCKNQGSYRARLTPKPWRIGVEAPFGYYPFDDPNVEHRYREWVQMYESTSTGYAACEFLEEFGTARPVSDFRKLIDIHDRLTRSGSGQWLA